MARLPGACHFMSCHSQGAECECLITSQLECQVCVILSHAADRVSCTCLVLPQPECMCLTTSQPECQTMSEVRHLVSCHSQSAVHVSYYITAGVSDVFHLVSCHSQSARRVSSRDVPHPKCHSQCVVIRLYHSQARSQGCQPVAWALSASVGSLVVVAVVVVRIFLGWQYVGDRLMSAAVDYEETGWYDGEVFVKPPEVLTRDRLLGMYEVKPIMAKLRSTLIGSGSMLLVCAVILSGIISATSDDDGMYGRGASMGRQTSDGVIFSKNVKALAELKEDDDKAAEEARAAGGVPGYCRDRVLRAAAGGQFCEKFNL
ncbi:hypothetical protein DUNSADRAFT_17174 [Dunaliella salina]|uniref:Uncharacterized protein n=1 Tax=Dunaliella salina TaxID=3046 RepID=A0ABQ7H0F7_DUNSA|nr:hypothetical protein DUNSADRAFT_17174 [Dunaliella salina]|eukprot:KAF5840330.1 hypothetical protein DUNSADRAFT_17174 [Dunaliella salina]